MIFDGTDSDAFERAGKGWTKWSRSIRYKIYKAQNEKKQGNDIMLPPSPSIQGTLGKPKTFNQTYSGNAIVINTTQKHGVQQTQRYSEKKNILDDIRDIEAQK